MRRLIFALLLAPMPVLAQELSPLSPNANVAMPQCGPTMDGQVMCRFGLIYECEFVDPNSTERRPGWRWKKDILRACNTVPPPADLPYDRRRGPPPDFTYAPQITDPGYQSGQSGTYNTPGSGRPGRR